MSEAPLDTVRLCGFVQRWRDGDRAAADDLLRSLGGRLEHLARKMLREFPRVRHWAETGDILQGAVLRLRPVMMTMLVATFGLVPAALSHAIGSDSQRPFAIVIVGGLITALVMSVFLLPTIYV